MGMFDIYRYGIGLMKLDIDEVMDLDLGTFISRVDGYLLLEDEQLDNLADTLMPYHATNSAMIIGSSGNMGKSYNPTEMATLLYPKEDVWGTSYTDSQPKNYEDSKDNLIKTFNIKEEDIK